ncbi:hypothetical protein BT96DRAFT_1006380 [Gymnopus androsaceus JB14]|uniref:Uncharacterized protein n=1 Tax=Gymnopus androsaceus JB14 TaxID=1447944 RepID=A0A6A4GL26_9AGAR|nr:hypothetical protein BT96DRAFT_1006380 [Gymnopus androsaceus JB14]
MVLRDMLICRNSADNKRNNDIIAINFQVPFILYYQYDPERASACPVTLHGILHIVKSIIEMGPIWAYWAYPMERFCGWLQLCIKSHQHPFAAIHNYLVLHAILSQIKLIYGLKDVLSLKPPRNSTPKGAFACPDLVWCHFNSDTIVQWAKVRRLGGGDDMLASELASYAENRRDATFICYDMHVDKNARKRNAPKEYVKKTFYGQLENICVITLPAAADLQLELETTLILVAVKRCKIQDQNCRGTSYYEDMGVLEVVDIAVVQCLVARIQAVNDMHYFILNRSGALQESYFVPGE